MLFADQGLNKIPDILIMLLVLFASQQTTFLVLIPLGLGLFEGMIHVVGIKIHKLNNPYTPSMIT